MGIIELKMGIMTTLTVTGLMVGNIRMAVGHIVKADNRSVTVETCDGHLWRYEGDDRVGQTDIVYFDDMNTEEVVDDCIIEVR